MVELAVGWSYITLEHQLTFIEVQTDIMNWSIDTD